MYESHFGFKELPFGLTPDPSYFFRCSSYREALETLLVAAYNGEGFIKIIGEVGYGKTILCRTFLAALQQADDDPQGEGAQVARALGRERRFVTAYLPNPYLDPRGLLLALAKEFGVEADRSADLHMLIKAVTSGLMDIAGEGRHAIVCLDEVQAMPQVTLEAVRLLTNLETEKRKLLQVVLFGQPELEEKLRQESARQMLQRITFQYTLTGLREDEVAAYLEHRLRVAGCEVAGLFEPDAVRLLHRYSGGTPRLVNILAHKALMLAFGEGVREIGTRQIKAAAYDTPAARRPRAFLDWLGQ
ncbi:MAG: ExeA family protein [Burkholderiales bacterium]